MNSALLTAHEKRDANALARLYRTAADRAERSGDMDQTCFYLTQAWVHALEAGSPAVQELQSRLVSYGRMRQQGG